MPDDRTDPGSHPSRYCAGPNCRRTTKRLRVRIRGRVYLYCVECGRRLELRQPRAG